MAKVFDFLNLVKHCSELIIVIWSGLSGLGLNKITIPYLMRVFFCFFFLLKVIASELKVSFQSLEWVSSELFRLLWFFVHRFCWQLKTENFRKSTLLLSVATDRKNSFTRTFRASQNRTAGTSRRSMLLEPQRCRFTTLTYVRNFTQFKCL